MPTGEVLVEADSIGPGRRVDDHACETSHGRVRLLWCDTLVREDTPFERRIEAGGEVEHTVEHADVLGIVEEPDGGDGGRSVWDRGGEAEAGGGGGGGEREGELPS